MTSSRYMRQALLLSVIALLLLGAENAEAAPFTPRLDFAYQLGVEYWGAEPTVCPSLGKEVVPATDLGFEGVVARLTVTPTMDCRLRVSDAVLAADQFAASCAAMVSSVSSLLGLSYFGMPPMCLRKQDHLVISRWSASAARNGRDRCRNLRGPRKRCWRMTRKLTRHARWRAQRFWRPLVVTGSRGHTNTPAG